MFSLQIILLLFIPNEFVHVEHNKFYDKYIDKNVCYTDG